MSDDDFWAWVGEKHPGEQQLVPIQQEWLRSVESWQKLSVSLPDELVERLAGLRGIVPISVLIAWAVERAFGDEPEKQSASNV